MTKAHARVAQKERTKKKLPRHLVRGGSLFLVGAGATFVMMANQAQLPHGPLWGIFTMLVATAGALDLLGFFRTVGAEAIPLEKTSWGRLEGEPEWVAPRYTVPVSIAILVGGGLLGGYDHLPWVIAVSLLVLVPPALRRPGLLVFVVMAALYLPLLGTYGLWDPWETHYGEVSREVLSRDDWISLWWAQENWFWSKPILIFWLEAISMGIFGVNFHPDAHPLHPEWAIRLPHFLMAVVAVLALYTAISRLFNKRAGVLAALALATMPLFFFLAHQAMTDMLFVGNMTVAMSLLALALAADPDREVKTFRIGRVALSARHAIVGALVITVLPEILYLFSRNITMVAPFQFAWHGDVFMFGSAGNGGVPGNAPLSEVQPFAPGFFAQPGMQGLYWLAGLLLILWFVWRERRVQPLLMIGFYYFCALSFMAKGLPGFALPGLVALLYLVASRRWALLIAGRLRVALGSLIVFVVGMPWYVAMYIRHGPPFTDRLLVHDHLNRLVSEETGGDKAGIHYYIQQLGFATFPWIALVPLALIGWLWYQRMPGKGDGTSYRDMLASEAQETPAERNQRETIILFALWFFASFTLFSAMVTKFYYYIFPAVPSCALMVGLMVDRMFGRSPSRGGWRHVIGTLLSMAAPAVLVLGVASIWGNVRGVIPAGVSGAAQATWVFAHGWNPMIGRALVVVGLVMAVGAAFRLRIESDRPQRPPAPPWEPKALWAGGALVAVAATFSNVLLAVAALVMLLVLVRVGRRAEDVEMPWERVALSAALAVGVVLVGLVGRDLSWTTTQRPAGMERLVQLYIYNYGRPWPQQFDYRPVLFGFGVVATGTVAAGTFRWARPVAARALVGLALLFAAWSLDVYMIDLSPHWSQKALIARYYAMRGSPEVPLVAWQMNWKGENFYTGNRVSAFVDLDNRKLRDWIGQHHGQKAFFILEHARLGNLRGLIHGQVKEVSTVRENNKFVLVEATL